MNYKVKGASFLRGSRLGLAVNNLLDNHSVTAIQHGAAHHRVILSVDR